MDSRARFARRVKGQESRVKGEAASYAGNHLWTRRDGGGNLLFLIELKLLQIPIQFFDAFKLSKLFLFLHI